MVKGMLELKLFTVAQLQAHTKQEESNVREWLYEFEADGLVRNPVRAKAIEGTGNRHKGQAPGLWEWVGV
jgi:hypothetical protein